VLRFHRAEVDGYSVLFHPPGLKALLAEVVRTARPDVAHVHHWFNLGNDLVAMLESLNVPSIVTLHDAYAACARFFMVRPDGFFCGDAMPVPMSRTDRFRRGSQASSSSTCGRPTRMRLSMSSQRAMMPKSLTSKTRIEAMMRKHVRISRPTGR